MKLQSKEYGTEDAEKEVNSFLEEIKDVEDVTGFICCVILGNGSTKTLIAANPKDMYAFAEELVKIGMTVDEFTAPPKGKVTLQ